MPRAWLGRLAHHMMSASLVFLPTLVLAHGLEAGRAEVQLAGRTLYLSLTPQASAFAFVDSNRDGLIDPAEVQSHRSLLERTFRQLVQPTSDVTWSATAFDVGAPELGAVPPAARYVRLTAQFEAAAPPRFLTVKTPWGLWSEFVELTSSSSGLLALGPSRRVALVANQPTLVFGTGPITAWPLVAALALWLVAAMLLRRQIGLRAALPLGALCFVGCALNTTSPDSGTQTPGALACPASGTVTTPGPTLSATANFNVTARQCTRTAAQLACDVSTTHQFSTALSNGKRTITSNAIVNHDVGDFPNPDNPNRITPQQYALSMPAEPALSGTTTPALIFGVALSGAVFDPGTAELWNGTPAWRYEALRYATAKDYAATDSIRHPQGLGVDCNFAHVQPGGQYHYHGVPNGLLGEAPRVTQVGWAADGFPVFARFGNQTPSDAQSAVVELRASYRLRSGRRPVDGPPGTYDGTFVQDWEYIAGLGDLDECNGRVGLVPVEGALRMTYHYVLTDAFPYIPRCWKGQPDESFTRLGAMNTMMLPQCMPGQTAMCCGDGTCDGPENRMTCAVDCR